MPRRFDSNDAFRDTCRGYFITIASRPNARRAGVDFVQRRTPQNASLISEAARSCHGSSRKASAVASLTLRRT
jgi:hypothetical protein